MSIKLEPGKHYKTRGGDIVKNLVWSTRGNSFATADGYEDDRWYTQFNRNKGLSGRHSTHAECRHDLVSEWHEPESSGVEATLNQRQKTHGEFSDHARIAQELKGCLIPVRGELPDTHMEALEMICHKMARILTGNPNEPDHWHDIAGYATLVEKEIKNGMAAD